MESFSKLLWLELIGLDNTKEDLGTTEFLARMSVKPEIISLLLWNTELIHSHTDMENDAPIGPKHCAYYARPRNEERERQDWTKFQLRKLIRLFQQNGIKVYVSFFDQLMSLKYQKERNIPIVHEWITDHPEMRVVTKDGRTGELAPLKRLADGSFYEDFFFSQLERFMHDYGFDGLHAADGYAHPRLPLCFADFSDDMLAQFNSWKDLEVQGETTEEKANWILQNLRKEWSVFHTDRQARFWKKGMDMLNRNNWGHCFNTCWTRDPLEAIWRYGIDYRKLADVGVRNFIQEAQAAVLDTEGWNKTGTPMQDQFRAISTKMKAYVPECKLILLHCVKDGMEQYNVLRHAPAFMDSDVFSLANTVYGSDRVLSGAMTCLSDGIRPAEWERIDRTYRRAFLQKPAAIPYPRIVWSDPAFQKMLKHYAEKHVMSAFRLHTSLISQGAVLYGSIKLSGHTQIKTGPLTVLHPAFYEKAELDEVRTRSEGNYALIGLFEDDSFGFELYVNDQKVEDLRTELYPPASWEEPISWLQELPEYIPSTDFIQKISNILNQNFALFHPEKDQSLIRTWGFYDENQDLRLFIGNEKRNYIYAEVRLKERFSSVDLLSDELILPPVVRNENDTMVIRVKLPPSGTIPLLLKK